MSEQAAVGRFCWTELGTSDAAGAKEFYTGLLGWTVEDMPMPQGGAYTMARIGGKDAAGMYGLMEEQLKAGVPPHWLPYIAVDDADAAAAKAKDLGGTVMMDAFDVMEIGRMAALQDPTGATFAVWQAKNQPGTPADFGTVGSFCWHECMTTDADRAGSFYTQLSNWGTTTKEVMPNVNYTVFTQGEVQVGGMMEIQPDMGPVPSHWMSYIAVENCDASAGKATELGAKVIVPPTDIPEVGRFALLQDPQGAMVSIITLLVPKE